MRINQILHNSKIEFRFNQVAHIIISISLLLVLMAISISQYRSDLTKSKITEGLNLATSISKDVSAYYFEMGHWPKSYTEKPNNKFSVFNSITFDGNGGIHILFNEKAGNASGKTLSYVASTSKAINAGNMIWNCGYANPPSAYQLTSVSQTNLPQSLVTFSCRKNTHIDKRAH